MKGMYFYRGQIIWKYKNGWLWGNYDHNIYKTINDARNAIDKWQGGYPTAKIPKRHNKSITIIGQFTEYRE